MIDTANIDASQKDLPEHFSLNWTEKESPQVTLAAFSDKFGCLAFSTKFVSAITFLGRISLRKLQPSQ